MPVELWVRHVGHLAALRDLVRTFAEPTGLLAHDISLAANELASNALTHAGSPCFVAADYVIETTLRLAVTDVAFLPLQLVANLPSLTANGGRGLTIVAATATRWGVEPAPSGKTVWFEVDFV